jgi:hypothetical protein
VLTNTSGSSSTNKSVTVTCSAGKVVIGGGGSSNLGQSITVYMFPANGPTYNQWTASGTENDNTGNSWTVTAWAICATP